MIGWVFVGISMCRCSKCESDASNSELGICGPKVNLGEVQYR